MKRNLRLIVICALFAISSCVGIKEHPSDKWNPFLGFFMNSELSRWSNSAVTLNVSLIGIDGKPLNISNAAERSASSAKGETAPAEDSNVGASGSGGEKAGEENLQVTFDGSAKAVEIYDSNGGYSGTITVTPRSGNETNTKSFLSFALMSDKDPAGGAINGIFHENTIVVDVPFSDITDLKMIFTHDGESVSNATDVIRSGTNSNFSNPLPLTVKAKDGTTKEYTVIVNKIQYTCELAGMYFTDYPMAKVSQKSDTASTWYEVSLPPDATLSSLKTSFSVYGTSVTVSGVTQSSGVSAQNFSSGSGVTFTAHGSNGCTQNFIVKATHETLKAGTKSLKGRSLTRGTLDLVDIPQITKVNTVGLGKPVSMIESEAFGYFDDVDGVYHITKGQIKVMVPWATPFDKEDILIEVETKNNAKKLTINGKPYTKGMPVRFTQKPGYEKHTIDAMLIDTYSAFEVPYEIQVVMGAPPPFLAVSKDSTFMLFVNSNAADARDEKKDLEALIKMFAPSKMGQINDLESLINYINNFQIDVARWTIDPGKVELNVIGRGFQNFDMDLTSYKQDYKCYNFKGAYENYLILFRNAKSDQEKFVLQSLAKDTHKMFCGGTKSYSAYPNFPKTAPSAGDYGKMNPNLDSMEGYGIKKWLSADDIAYFFTNFMGEKPDQESNSFTVKSKKGAALTYSLPSPNTVTYSPTEGTVGTEIYATLMAPINPAVFNVSFTMDKIPVLNPSFEFDDKGFIKAVRFNVPYISKSTRIVGERIPISGRGEKFIFYGGETFKFKPYRELKGLSYESNSFDYTVGVEANFNYPRVESGKATYYTIKSGKIPAGMIFARNVGLIYGKPVATMSPTQVVIEANDGYKQVQTTLQISASLPVVVPSPTLLYSASGYTLLSGKKFTIAPIGVSGTNVRYTIDRPLPTGFQFDRETGVFSGYPTNLMSPTTFVVRASNPVGFAIFTISFQVISDKAFYAPPTLSYSATSYTLGRGYEFRFTPTFGGTAPNNFSAVGLPDGMNIDTFTGVISGTPTTLQETSEAIVTLSNYAGVAQFKTAFSVSENAPAPTNLVYAGTPFTFTTLVNVGVIKPTHTSIITSCSSTPTLPAGLILNPNCEITGTAITTQSSTIYTITGTNVSGSVNTTINMTIVAIPPSNLVYAGTPFMFAHNSTVSPITPTMAGNASSCVSSPSLPAGLAINSTCVIAGTPTTMQVASNYTITATNPYGSTTAVISITVAAMAPSNLLYVGTPYIFFQSTASSSGTPSYSGSPITSCTSSPSLPAGLSISSTTCTISGSPSSQQASTTYTITAGNASGTTQATIQIAIGPQPPNNLLYVGSPFMFYKNVAKTVTPTMTGTPTSCTASPTLPAGLSINNTTCAISGTATTVQDPVTYTITATNASGTTTATLSIQVAIEWYRSDIKLAGPAYPREQSDVSIDGTDWVGIRNFYSGGNDFLQIYSGNLSGVSYTIGGQAGLDEQSTGVSISGDRLAIGLPFDETTGNTIVYGSRPTGTGSTLSGAVLLYKKNGTNWELEAFFKASDAATNQRFGNSVALDGDTLVVAREGGVYIYRLNGTVWQQEAFINSFSSPLDVLRTEHSVKISGDLLGISGGDSGCWGDARKVIQIYKRTGTTWADTGKSVNMSGNTGGFCVGKGHFELKGDLLVFGQNNHWSNLTGIFNGTTYYVNNYPEVMSGAVRIFRWNGTDYIQEAFIKPPYATLGYFGFRVGVSTGDIVSVMAYENTTSGGIYNSTSIPPDTSGNKGGIYIYRKTSGVWKWESFIKENSLATAPNYGLGPGLGMFGENIVATCGGSQFCFYRTR